MRKQRKYAPFVKVGKRWIRATWKDGENKPAFTKEQAIRIYQHWLLAPVMEGINETRELRPVKD
jgi:hypothetical protein